METFSLFQLNEYIRRVIALNFQDSIWIKAEVSQIKSSRGHYYLDLIEKEEHSEAIKAQASAVIWYKTSLFLKKKLGSMLDALLETGNEIKVKISVDFHERYGMSLEIQDIDASFTLGKAELLRKEILEKLDAEGLIELNSKKNFPLVIQRIALISSSNAAGYKDFISYLNENDWNYKFDVNLFNSAVQGKNVESDIVQAFNAIESSKIKYDCIIIIRGGGSKLELSAFDNYLIAKHIAHAHLPVITGIGHEIDQSIADIVSKQAVKTPTAAASFLIDWNNRFEAGLNDLGLDIQKATKRHIEQSRLKLSHHFERIISGIKRILEKEKSRSEERTISLSFHTIQLLNKEKYSLNLLAQNILANSPEKIMEKGYSLISQKGRVIRTINEIDPAIAIENQLIDGTIKSKIIDYEQ